ncbi:hypothetical protein D3C73_1126170 [compost metagenome]
MFNTLVKSPDAARGDPPVVGYGIVHDHAHAAEDLHGHGDVVQAGNGLAHVLQMQALNEAGTHQQQRGNELGRCAGVNHQMAAPDLAGTVHSEGKGRRRPAAVRCHRNAEGDQGFDDGSHGSVACVGVAVEDCYAVTQCSQRGNEPHDGSGQSAVDCRLRARRSRIHGCNFQVRSEVAVTGYFGDGCTQLPEGLDHQCGVAGMKGSPQP